LNVCFVYTYEIHITGDASDRVLGLFGKLWRRRRGALALFHGIWTQGAKVLEY
jgi:hypothetical protein